MIRDLLEISSSDTSFNEHDQGRINSGFEDRGYAAAKQPNRPKPESEGKLARRNPIGNFASYEFPLMSSLNISIIFRELI